MKIEVFGPGCPRCLNAERVIRAALVELGRDAEVVKISDMEEIINRGILLTPAVIIDGKKVCEGKVPTADMVKGWLE